MRGVLDLAPGTPLLRKRRLTVDAPGVPIEWSEDRYRSDVATVTVNNTRGARSARRLQLLAPGARCPVPGSRLPAPGSRLPAPGSRLPAPDRQLLTPRTESDQARGRRLPRARTGTVSSEAFMARTCYKRRAGINHLYVHVARGRGGGCRRPGPVVSAGPAPRCAESALEICAPAARRRPFPCWAIDIRNRFLLAFRDEETP
ncbi:UTRA domain-containing protein [Streptomyces sp. NBC_00448]|uniref:UTRA domain-containing protein n=1 Tax=Streptomyces sp. NBC_00448 TaxID=2903652 RepID=UPI003FA73770